MDRSINLRELCIKIMDTTRWMLSIRYTCVCILYEFIYNVDWRYGDFGMLCQFQGSGLQHRWTFHIAVRMFHQIFKRRRDAVGFSISVYSVHIRAWKFMLIALQGLGRFDWKNNLFSSFFKKHNFMKRSNVTSGLTGARDHVNYSQKGKNALELRFLSLPLALSRC